MSSDNHFDLATANKEYGANYLSKKGMWEWLRSVDHKRIGVLYLVTGLLFFLIGGVFALLLRTELIAPGQTIMDPQTYNVMFTLHGTIMIFIFVVPGIIASFGNFCLPIMIGAPDVAFPRLNRFSFQLWVIGVVVILLGLLIGKPVDTGWTFYTPYSSKTDTNVIGMVLGAFILGFSSILTGLNFIITVHKLRAPGMTWFRMPLFVWSIYAAAIIQVIATPVIGVTLLLLIAERIFGIGFFDATKGGDPVLFQHFFWFYSHPVVYIMILPAMGVVSEIIPCFSRKPIFGYKPIAWSTISIAAISFLVWGHHLFLSNQSASIGILFSFLTFFVAVPTAIKVFNWLATMYRGQISLQSPMLYALAFLFLFIIGGLTGLFLGTIALDIPLHDTYFVVAHFHYTIQGGTVLALVGALHYWFPKITGKTFNEKFAVFTFILIFIGFNLTFIPQFLVGMEGMPRRYYDYLPHWQPFHFWSTIGSYILGGGYFLSLMNFVYAAFKGGKAEENPWRARTLEWQIPSPPPHYNFDKIPTITKWPYDYGQNIPADGEKLK